MATNIALLGFGTVGKGTYRALTINSKDIEKKTGKDIKIVKILEKNPAAIKSGVAPENIFTQDYNEILNDKSISIVVEMMGGIEPASTFMMQALEAGKNVVTPNKAAVAKNYEKLHALAKEHGVCIRYEAAVGGAIPVIEAIGEALVANKISKIEGIVNGTTNYILTKMEEEKLSYADALKQAQEKGFAEADPTADVEGIDAANKLCILCADAFGKYIDPEKLDRTGISKVIMADLEDAKKKHCKIKLIASATLNDDGTVSASVKPTFVEESSMLATVRNEFNGILLHCNMADDIFLYGRGAGMDPTGSAVAADIVKLA